MIDFNNIKAVGFDLDNTLYENDPEIDKRIQLEVSKKVLEKKQELETLECAMKFCEDIYKKVGSRTKTLKLIGFPNAEEIMYECMSRADFTDLLSRDSIIIKMLKKIKKRYKTFLITGTPYNLALPRLNKIGIDLSDFWCSIFGDTPNAGNKIDGSIYSFFLSKSPYPPENHIYIGDSLEADIIPAINLGIKTIGKRVPEADISIEVIYDLEKLLF